jgi:hypothetical protein
MIFLTFFFIFFSGEEHFIERNIKLSIFLVKPAVQSVQTGGCENLFNERNHFWNYQHQLLFTIHYFNI